MTALRFFDLRKSDAEICSAFRNSLLLFTLSTESCFVVEQSWRPLKSVMHRLLPSERAHDLGLIEYICLRAMTSDF